MAVTKRRFLLGWLAVLAVLAGVAAMPAPAAAQDEEAADGPAFIELQKMTLTLFQPDGSTETLQLELTLEVADAEAEAEVERLEPRLVDAFVRGLYGLNDRQLLITANKQLDLDAMTAALRERGNEVLETDGILSVLVRAANRRRGR